MKKLATLLAIVAVAGLMLTAAPQEAQARPQYAKALGKKYEKVADALKEKKCGACHGNEGKNKKVLSDYGKALKEALGAKNVKDEAEIDKGFDAAGKKDAGDRKTYADLLKDGKLPPPAKDE